MFDIYLLYLLPAVIVIAYLAFYRADHLIMLSAFLVPLSVTVHDLGFGVGLNIPTEPIIILIMLVAILKLVHEGVWDWEFIRHPITLAVLFNLAWLILSGINSTMPIVSLKYIISRLWYIIVFYFFASHLFYNLKNIRRFIWLFLVSAIGVVSY